MNYDDLLNLSTEIGYRLLENGGEIYRVEESISRILQAYGIQNGDVFTIPSCIIVTIQADSGHPLTRIKRIRSLGVNVEKVNQFNNLCRWICRDTPTFDVVQAEITKINDTPPYTLFAQILATASISLFFTLFYGGGIIDAFWSFIIGIFLKVVLHNMGRFQANAFFSNIVGSFIVALLSVSTYQIGWTVHYDKMIIGTLMNLVPGIAITNVMRDIISGDLIAGMIKLTEALMVAMGIALGAGLALTIFRSFFPV